MRRALNKGRLISSRQSHATDGERLPIPRGIGEELRKLAADLEPEALLFTTKRGTRLSYRNQLTRVFKPAAEEAGAEWAAFHTLRHTFASLHIARGTNTCSSLTDVWGTTSPDFTLRVYAHMIPGDKVAALDLDAELGPRQFVPHIGMALGSDTDSAASEAPAMKGRRAQ